ncbi:MAG TPA: hypothetical protein VG756_07320 [Pseudonocardiaceae bacterium]|nr:hypothetical protein [Pseudonocardiaceae bacterium]
MPAPRPRSALDVLYTTSPLLLSTPNTLLAGDRVFTGAQTDEFAVAGLLAATDRVCLLGLAYGAAIRTLHTFLPDVHVTAVDIDAVSGTICVELYRRHFPRLPFDFVHQDALEFLLGGAEKFDVICVDLYLPEGYANLLSRPGFWTAVRDRLTPNGVVLVNAGGLPIHLEPLRPPSPQAALLTLLTRYWPNPRYLANKRNWTIILESAPTPDHTLADRALRANGFTGADRAIAQLLPLRLRAAPRVGELPDIEPESFTRQHIDAEIERRWPTLTAALRQAGAARGIAPSRTRPDVVVADPETGPTVLTTLLEQGSIVADFFASAAASLAMTREPEVGWFGQWLCDQADWLTEKHSDWLLRAGFPQALAMLACPLAPRWPWEDTLLELTARFVESDENRR